MEIVDITDIYTQTCEIKRIYPPYVGIGHNGSPLKINRTEDAAEELKYHAEHVRCMIRDCSIEEVKIGRIWLVKNTVLAILSVRFMYPYRAEYQMGMWTTMGVRV
jgi:hypothetical protein